jgi:hypothetical protein
MDLFLRAPEERYVVLMSHKSFFIFLKKDYQRFLEQNEELICCQNEKQNSL